MAKVQQKTGPSRLAARQEQARRKLAQASGTAGPAQRVLHDAEAWAAAGADAGDAVPAGPTDTSVDAFLAQLHTELRSAPR